MSMYSYTCMQCMRWSTNNNLAPSPDLFPKPNIHLPEELLSNRDLMRWPIDGLAILLSLSIYLHLLESYTLDTARGSLL